MQRNEGVAQDFYTVLYENALFSIDNNCHT